MPNKTVPTRWGEEEEEEEERCVAPTGACRAADAVDVRGNVAGHRVVDDEVYRGNVQAASGRKRGMDTEKRAIQRIGS